MTSSRVMPSLKQVTIKFTGILVFFIVGIPDKIDSSNSIRLKLLDISLKKGTMLSILFSLRLNLLFHSTSICILNFILFSAVKQDWYSQVINHETISFRSKKWLI